MLLAVTVPVLEMDTEGAVMVPALVAALVVVMLVAVMLVAVMLAYVVTQGAVTCVLAYSHGTSRRAGVHKGPRTGGVCWVRVRRVEASRARTTAERDV